MEVERAIVVSGGHSRRMLRVEIADAFETDRVFYELMGKDASERFRFIMDRADQALELDV